MKKIPIAMFLFMLIICIFFIPTKNVAAEKYTTFEEIIFENSYVTLLDTWDKSEEEYYLTYLTKHPMFGWDIYYTLRKEPFTYIAETLYHVKNLGQDSIQHTFKYEESYEDTIQRSVKGDIKVSGSYSQNSKKGNPEFKGGLEAKLEFEYKQSIKTKTTESDTVKIIVAPNSELFIKVKGKGYLYQGVAKKFFCFVNTQKGAFEYAVITTEYYSIDMEAIENEISYTNETEDKANNQTSDTIENITTSEENTNIQNIEISDDQTTVNEVDTQVEKPVENDYFEDDEYDDEYEQYDDENEEDEEDGYSDFEYYEL